MTRKPSGPARCPASHTGAHLWIDPDTGRPRQKGERQGRLFDWVCMACGKVKTNVHKAPPAETP